MSLSIEPYTEEDIPEIRRFNERLLGVQSDFTFPTKPSDLMPVGPPGCPVSHELFLAKEGSIVRGGFAFKHERLYTAAGAQQIANLQIPLSEALVDKKFSNVGVVLLRDALHRVSALYCLGMGSTERPLPKLLERLRWQVDYVPFLFRVIRPRSFLSEIRYFRGRRFTEWVLRVLAVTGIASIAGAVWAAVDKLRRPRLPNDWSVEQVESFDDSVTSIFSSRSPDEYPVLCDRTADALNFKFPAHDERLIRLVVRDSRAIVGWIVLTRTKLKNHRQFGDMALGCIVDGFCALTDVSRLVSIGVQRLVEEKVDLVVSNQMHGAWIAGLKSNSFLSGPSNFVLAVSPKFGIGLPDRGRWHFNRGDGDGPINL